MATLLDEPEKVFSDCAEVVRALLWSLLLRLLGRGAVLMVAVADRISFLPNRNDGMDNA